MNRSTRGVGWDERRQKWQAQAGWNGESHYLGHFDLKCDAINARAEFDRTHPPRFALSLEEEVAAKTEKSGGCWEWRGAKHISGYGTIRFNGKRRRAHRVTWELTNGPIPDGLHVLHRCDNPGCVNTNHLFLGTHDGNMADCTAKNRHAKGEQNGKTKITESDVRDMRALHRSDSLSLAELGRRFGVSKTTAGSIVSGLSWGHVK